MAINKINQTITLFFIYKQKNKSNIFYILNKHILLNVIQMYVLFMLNTSIYQHMHKYRYRFLWRDCAYLPLNQQKFWRQN